MPKHPQRTQQLSLFDLPAEKTQLPHAQFHPQGLTPPQDHHHMELGYVDGYREVICTANPRNVRRPGNNYAGWVGAIPSGRYCPICAQADKDAKRET